MVLRGGHYFLSFLFLPHFFLHIYTYKDIKESAYNYVGQVKGYTDGLPRYPTAITTNVRLGDFLWGPCKCRCEERNGEGKRKGKKIMSTS